MGDLEKEKFCVHRNKKLNEHELFVKSKLIKIGISDISPIIIYYGKEAFCHNNYIIYQKVLINYIIKICKEKCKSIDELTDMIDFVNDLYYGVYLFLNDLLQEEIQKANQREENKKFSAAQGLIQLGS